MEINVTQDDIIGGIPHSPSACPIAKALKRKFNYDHAVLVFEDEISILNHTPASGVPWKIKKAWLPTEAVEFIAAFDEGRRVDPFSFEVELK